MFTLKSVSKEAGVLVGITIDKVTGLPEVVKSEKERILPALRSRVQSKIKTLRTGLRDLRCELIKGYNEGRHGCNMHTGEVVAAVDSDEIKE